MKRIALLVTVLALGCSNKRPEERKLQGSAAPPSTPAPAPAGSAATGSAAGSGASAGSAGPGSAAAEAQKAGFAPFDDALAGTRPWIAADDKAGIVELHAVEDRSDRTRSKLTVERRCGADAAKAAEALGKQIAERARSGHPAPACKEEGGITSCVQPGLTDADVTLELEYGKSGDAWRVIGAKTYSAGAAAKEEAKYAALLKEPCK